MRNIVMAIAVGLVSGLAGVLWSRMHQDAPAPVASTVVASGDALPDAPAHASVFVAPTQPGLIVTVVGGAANVQLFRDEFDLIHSERRWLAAGAERTDAANQVTFPAFAGHYFALAMGDDAQATLEFDVSRATGPTAVTITLEPLRTLTGLIHRENSVDPIAGAVLRIDPGERTSIAVARVVADAFGRVTAKVPANAHYTLEASAPGFVTSTITIAIATNEKIDLGLAPGVKLEGLVVDAQGTPVSDVTVRLAPGNAAPVISDREGRFIATVPIGPTSLHALALDGRQALDRITTTAGQSVHRVQLRLTTGDTLSGIVVSSGLAASGADVRVLAEPDDLEVARILTGTDGRFEAKGLPRGRYLVRAQKGPGRRGSVVGLELPGTPPVEVTLCGAGKLTGLVLDDSQVPIAGATVTLEWTRGMNEIERTARTDADGRYEFDEMLPAEVSVKAHLDELVSSEESIYVGPDSTAEVNLTLAVQGRLVGTVEPPAGETVLVRGASLSEQVKIVGGRFEKLLAPGKYRLFIASGEHFFSEQEAVMIRPGEVTTVTLSSKPTDAGFHTAFGHPDLASGLSFENAPGGVRVDFLMSDCPAAQAGVKLGDLVLSIDGDPTKDALDAFARVRKPNGTQLALQVRREGRDLQLTVR